MPVNRCLSAAASLLAVWCAASLSFFAAEARAADGRTPKEQALIAVLRGDAAEGDKAVACKELAVFGSADAVPDLAKLLGNERLASWARIPLEAIPDPACDAALRDAAGRLSGRLLVGVLNSLGVRRDAAAVELLARRLGDGDPAVVDAAAAALGNVGTAGAADALRKALASAAPAARASAAEGCVLCAERMLAANQAAAAAALYDAVRKADVPRQRVVEATRGAILARGEQGVPLLVEQLRSTDREMHRIALGTARELKAAGVGPALIAELQKAPPERAVLLIEALADRGGTAAVPAMLQAAASGPQPVRLSAVRALGRLGDASCVERLLTTAADGDADLSTAAKAALAEMSGGGKAIDDQIRGRLAQAQGASLPLLIELVGRRRIAAVNEVAAAVANADPAVRGKALACLGEIVDLERLPLLVQQVVAPKDPADAAAAIKALRAASVRMPDREACAEKLVSALSSASPDTKVALLEILGEVGGTKSLAALSTAARSDDPALQDASTRLLGNWLTPDAGPALLELAKTLPAGKFQSRAFRGYLRILRQFTASDADRSRMGRDAYAIARTADDRKAVLDAVRRTPTMDMLKLAAEAGETPELREEARIATATLMSKMGDATPEAWALAGRLGLPKVQLEILRATYGAGDVQKDVTTPLRKVVGNTPLIPLPAAGYNASFGGDPAPGKAKRLTIQYKLDGTPGEASFAEDATILLPVPGAAAAASGFKKRTLTERFVAEGCDIADFDHDGHVDVTAGNMIWYGPDFARRADFTPPADNPGGPNKTPYDPAKGYSDYFLAYAHDFNGDGWADILVFGFPGDPALLYLNPQGKEGHWEKHAIFDVADGESPDLKDVTGDGKPELLVHSSDVEKPKNAQQGGQLGFAEIDWQNPLGKARFRAITPKSPENDKKYFRYTHGYGAGDVNKDGRIDILTKDGWFEQPADITRDAIWPFHPGPFGPAGGARGGGHMHVYDVNGDGRNDVITSYDGHGFGLGWFEQNADGSFTEHLIMGKTPEENAQGVKFSQLHAMRLVDMNGDGLADIVTGKRRWAHGINGDDEPNAPPVLYWFELKRDGKGAAQFIAHQIDDDSGVGTQVTVGDLDKDGKPDVIVANKRGVFTFTQQ